MLCIIPISSELRAKLISAARGFVTVATKGDARFEKLYRPNSECLLFEFCSSQRKGSGAFFFVVGELGRSTWYGLDAG